MQVLSAQPQPLTTANPSVGAGTAAVILKALEKHPKHRYQTALAFAEDMTQVLSGQRARAQLSGLRARLADAAAHHPVVVTACTIVAVMLTVLATVFVAHGQQTRNLHAQLNSNVVTAVTANVRDLLKPAFLLLKEQHHLTRYGLLANADHPSMGSFLAERLRLRPQLHWLCWVTPDGTFTGARWHEHDLTTNTVVHVLIRRTGDASSVQDTYRIDADGSRERISGETADYDPRKRPFYTRALESPIDTPLWTEPFKWVALPGMGVSAVIAVRDGDKLIGVFTAGYHLEQTITPFLSELQRKLSARCFLVTPTGEFVAGERAPEGDIPPDVTAALAAAKVRLPTLVPGITLTIPFATSETTRYSAAFERFDLEGGLSWVSVTILPTRSALAAMPSAARATLLACSLGLIALLIAAFVTDRRRKQHILTVARQQGGFSPAGPADQRATGLATGSDPRGGHT